MSETPDDDDANVFNAIHYPTWKKSKVLYHTVSTMSIRDKRKVFSLLRENCGGDNETILLRHGYTIGDFCVMYLLSEHRK